MKNVNEIIEVFSSSTWGHHSIWNAIQSVEDLLNNINLYVFRKKRQTTREEGLKVFREGWILTDIFPTFYMCLGSMSEYHQVGYYMPTLVSIQGEPKTKIDLPVSHWSNWHTFTLLFGEDAFFFSEGKVSIKNKKKTSSLLIKWKEILSHLDSHPMHRVLDLYYSKFELSRIEMADAQQVCLWIDELEKFARDKVRTISEEDTLPLLAKGLTGLSKTLETRRQMRIAFWKAWNTRRCDLIIFAKTFQSPTAQIEWKYA